MTVDPQELLIGWFLLAMCASILIGKWLRSGDEDELIQCDYCSDWFDIDGPGNLFVHIVHEHPTSNLASAIRQQLALDARLKADR